MEIFKFPVTSPGYPYFLLHHCMKDRMPAGTHHQIGYAANSRGCGPATH